MVVCRGGKEDTKNLKRLDFVEVKKLRAVTQLIRRCCVLIDRVLYKGEASLSRQI